MPEPTYTLDEARAPVRDELLSLWHGMSWRSHLWWFKTPHPAARRAKTEYRRRRR